MGLQPTDRHERPPARHSERGEESVLPTGKIRFLVAPLLGKS